MKNYLIILISILFGSFATGEVTGYPMYLPSFPYRNIYSLTCTDDTLYLCGDITYIGPHTGYGAVFDRTTKELLPFPYVDGTILDSASDGENGWFINGLFTQVGCTARPGLAHIFANGTLDTGWNPPLDSSEPYASDFEVNNNAVFYINSDILYSVCKTGRGEVLWQIPAQHWSEFHCNKTCTRLYFVEYNCVKSSEKIDEIKECIGRVLALNANTGALETLSVATDGTINTMTVIGDMVYIGGHFSTVGGISRNNIASIDGISGEVSSWNPDFTELPIDMAANTDTLFVAGQSNGNFIHTYRLDNGEPGTPFLNGVIHGDSITIDVNDNDLYVSGRVLYLDGYYRQSIRSYDSNTLFPDFSRMPLFPYIINTVSISDSTIFTGGYFQSVDGVSRKGSAAIDLSTGMYTSFKTSFYPYSCLVFEDCIYANGFEVVNKLSRETGDILESYTYNFNYSFSQIVKTSDKIFGFYGDNVGFIDLSTGAVQLCDLNFDKTIFSLTGIGDTLYAGGEFTSVNGLPRMYLAAFDANTLEVLDWSPPVTGPGIHYDMGGVNVVLSSPDRNIIVAGGKFRYELPEGYSINVGCFDAATGACALPIEYVKPLFDGYSNYYGIDSMAIGGNTLYVSFTQTNTVGFDLSTGRMHPWFLANDIHSGYLAATDDKLFIAREESYNYPDFLAYHIIEDDGALPSRHSSDMDGDGRINLTEILRTVQFFNLNAFHCAFYPTPLTDDGYAPGIGEECHDCPRHSADYRDPAWHFDIAELLRVIQFFNMGGYHACPGEGTEDGYCPGAIP